jgi:tetratricopeptide (TPR) repeat protein
VLDPLLPPQHPLRVQFNAVRGMIAKTRGDLPTAQREFEAAETAQAALNQADPNDLAILRMRLAGVLLARGDLTAARHKLDAALPQLDGSLLPQAVELIEAHRYADELARREKASPASGGKS